MSRVPVWAIHQRQSLPLECKVEMSLARIRSWWDENDGNVFVSFSGGKDSTVLLNLVRSLYPDVPAVFVHTGLEFPEIVRFAAATDNVKIVRPKMSFREVLDRYGYPVISRRIAQYIHEVQHTTSPNMRRLRLKGVKRDGSFTRLGKIPTKWQYLVDAPFRISHKCCDVMKKRPLKGLQQQFGAPFVGIKAEDSNTRKLQFAQHGCNRKFRCASLSAPLAYWTDEDIWRYIANHHLPYSPIYDRGYSNTGCIYCCFGVHLDPRPNRFELLRSTHPALWAYCMEELGLREVLSYIGVPTGEEESWLWL